MARTVADICIPAVIPDVSVLLHCIDHARRHSRQTLNWIVVDDHVDYGIADAIGGGIFDEKEEAFRPVLAPDDTFEVLKATKRQGYLACLNQAAREADRKSRIFVALHPTVWMETHDWILRLKRVFDRDHSSIVVGTHFGGRTSTRPFRLTYKADPIDHRMLMLRDWALSAHPIENLAEWQLKRVRGRYYVWLDDGIRATVVEHVRDHELEKPAPKRKRKGWKKKEKEAVPVKEEACEENDVRPFWHG